jgi:hypothetical protein
MLRSSNKIVKNIYRATVERRIRRRLQRVTLNRSEVGDQKLDASQRLKAANAAMRFDARVSASLRDQVGVAL